jgi:hypothetical protein
LSKLKKPYIEKFAVPYYGWWSRVLYNPREIRSRPSWNILETPSTLTTVCVLESQQHCDLRSSQHLRK